MLTVLSGQYTRMDLIITTLKSNHKMVMKTVILNIEMVMGFISHGHFFIIVLVMFILINSYIIVMYWLDNSYDIVIYRLYNSYDIVISWLYKIDRIRLYHSYVVVIQVDRYVVYMSGILMRCFKAENRLSGQCSLCCWYFVPLQ